MKIFSIESKNSMKIQSFLFTIIPIVFAWNKIILRKCIDVVDDRLIYLLHTRMHLAKQTRLFKDQIHDPIREQQIIHRLQNKNMLRNEFIEKLYPVIFNETKYLQTLHE